MNLSVASEHACIEESCVISFDDQSRIRNAIGWVGVEHNKIAIYHFHGIKLQYTWDFMHAKCSTNELVVLNYSHTFVCSYDNIFQTKMSDLPHKMYEENNGEAAI